MSVWVCVRVCVCFLMHLCTLYLSKYNHIQVEIDIRYTITPICQSVLYTFPSCFAELLSISIQDDGVTDEVEYTTSTGSIVYYNHIDCGLIPNPPASTDVIIEDCSRTYPGFICKAGIPDAEAVAIHPEP